MKKKIFIHIGTHKTGSTSIQRIIRKNKILLQKKGLIYIPHPSEVSSLMTCKKLDTNIIRALQNRLENFLSNNAIQREDRSPQFVMSWEGFSGDPLAGYKNAGIVAEHIKKATNSFEVNIIVYLRHQGSFVESLYTQKIHEGESYSFRSFIKTIPSYSWEYLLKEYAIRFGKENIIVRRYHKNVLPKQDSLLKDFFTIVGIDFNDLTINSDLVTKNRGYTKPAIRIARICNPFLSDLNRKRLRRFLQKVSAKKPFETYVYFSDQEREKFMSEYSDSNARVAIEFLNDQSGMLFPKNGKN